MNLLRFDIQQSRLIPFVAISLLTTHLAVSFFDMEMYSASYAALAGMSLTFLVALFLLIRKKTLYSFDFVVLLFIFILEGISLLNGTDWKNWLYSIFAISSYLFLFNFYKEKYHILVLGILFVLSVATYCQLYQCITHPEMWLIEEEKNFHGFILGGNYNGMGIRFIIALTMGILSLQYSKWFWLNLIPLFLCSFAILLMVRSMTSLSCLSLLLIFFLIRNQRILSLGIAGIYIGVLLFQTLVCFSGKGIENNDLATWFVIDILGKDLTFTGRTELWDASIRIFADSPIWGYGFVDGDWFIANMSSRAAGAHNFILNTMVYGGIILLILYFTIIFKSLQNLLRINDIYAKRLLLIFGVISIMMLFEAYPTPLVFLLLTIMFYYPGPYQQLNTNPCDRQQLRNYK